MKETVQAGWSWVSGVMCDRRTAARVKGKVSNMAVRPAVMFGLGMEALTEKQEAELKVSDQDGQD